MRPRLEDLRIKMLEKCFDCFCQNGLENTSTRKLAEACGMTDGNIFHYFTSKDEIIIKSTAYCMAKVEDEDYLKPQIALIGEMLPLITEKYAVK